MQKIADREKIMESAEVLFAVFKGDRVHDKMQMTVHRVRVQGISAYHSGTAHIVKNAVQSCCVWILIADQDNVWRSRFISSLIITFVL